MSKNRLEKELAIEATLDMFKKKNINGVMEQRELLHKEYRVQNQALLERVQQQQLEIERLRRVEREYIMHSSDMAPDMVKTSSTLKSLQGFMFPMQDPALLSSHKLGHAASPFVHVKPPAKAKQNLSKSAEWTSPKFTASHRASQLNF